MGAKRSGFSVPPRGGAGNSALRSWSFNALFVMERFREYQNVKIESEITHAK